MKKTRIYCLCCVPTTHYLNEVDVNVNMYLSSSSSCVYVHARMEHVIVFVCGYVTVVVIIILVFFLLCFLFYVPLFSSCVRFSGVSELKNTTFFFVFLHLNALFSFEILSVCVCARVLIISIMRFRTISKKNTRRNNPQVEIKRKQLFFCRLVTECDIYQPPRFTAKAF